MTSSRSLKHILIISGILLIPSISYLILSSGKNQFERLSIYGPRELPESGSTDTIFHQVDNFKLYTQDSSQYIFNEHNADIIVANFFFATCQTICPKMSSQMERIQANYKDDNRIELLSFSVDPSKDTLEALRIYADLYNAIPEKWYFLTGDKKTIYDIARYGFYLTVMEGDGGSDDFIHSEKIVLLDKHRRIRGYYDGTNYEDVGKLIDEIVVLKWEYENYDPK